MCPELFVSMSSRSTSCMSINDLISEEIEVLVQEGLIIVVAECEQKPFSNTSCAPRLEGVAEIGERNFANGRLHAGSRQRWQSLKSRPIWSKVSEIRHYSFENKIPILCGMPG